MPAFARVLFFLTMAALAAWGRAGWADTPPGVWDLARDPAERERWALHVRVERLLHRRATDDLLPSEQRRDEELRLAAARAMLEEAGAETSPDVRLRFDLGIVYERLATAEGRNDLYQRVVDILAPALAIAPDHPAATFALEALVETYAKLDRPREEVAVSRRYIARLSDDRSRALTMMNMGEAEMRLGRLDDALGTFRNVLQICGALPNSGARNSTYALTLWDLAVALDRGGDARAALDTAAKAEQLTWDELGPMGLPHNVTGWDAIRDQQNVFFVPDWEREWYLALGDAAAAGAEQDDRAAAALWASAE
ncbi:MAG TPA: tetratricopeptide repeat protein, partial [Polyangiaceae bacterium]|nr:tetratricopeptide repeat protein [Polyangiaceae bacterium]